MSESNNKLNWQPMIELALVLITVLGSTISLYLHSDSKLESYSLRNQEILEGIRQDMKEFHMEIKDFHGRLCAIEERNKSK